jgi:hypothetical protein
MEGTPILIVPDPTKTLVWSDCGKIFLLDEWSPEGMPSCLASQQYFYYKFWEWEYPFVVNKNNNSLYLEIDTCESFNWINQNRNNIDLANDLEYSNCLDFNLLEKQEHVYFFWDYKRDILLCGKENLHEMITQCTRFTLVDDLDLILHNQKFLGLIIKNASFHSAFSDTSRNRENYLGKINTDGLNDIEKELIFSFMEEYARIDDYLMNESYISSAFIEDFREKVTTQSAYIREELFVLFQQKIKDEEGSEAYYKWHTAYFAAERIRNNTI